MDIPSRSLLVLHDHLSMRRCIKISERFGGRNSEHHEQEIERHRSSLLQIEAFVVRGSSFIRSKAQAKIGNCILKIDGRKGAERSGGLAKIDRGKSGV